MPYRFGTGPELCGQSAGRLQGAPHGHCVPEQFHWLLLGRVRTAERAARRGLYPAQPGDQLDHRACRVHAVAGVSGLQLAPFIKLAERFGWIRPSRWMLNIEAGFEIWSGGKGLATSSFTARA